MLFPTGDAQPLPLHSQDLDEVAKVKKSNRGPILKPFGLTFRSLCDVHARCHGYACPSERILRRELALAEARERPRVQGRQRGLAVT